MGDELVNPYYLRDSYTEFLANDETALRGRFTRAGRERFWDL